MPRQISILTQARMALVASTVAAEDNPFGLPAPRDAKRPGVVVLHGGGYGLGEEVRAEFVRLAGGVDARILLMPSDMAQRGKDSDGNPVAGGETIEAYERRLASPDGYPLWAAMKPAGEVADFQFLYRRNDSEADEDRFYGLLAQATGVWLPAYDQEWHPKEFAADYPNTTSRFQTALREVVARGGVVGGLGGGMSSLAETIIASDAPTEDGWIRA